MKRRDQDFRNVIRRDFMYQNMTEEEIAGSNYTLDCIKDSVYVYLRIFNPKAGKYIFYLLNANRIWASSRIKDINMLEEMGRVEPLVNSATIVTFYLPESNDFVVYTNLEKTKSRGSQLKDLNIESKDVIVMTVHNKYPRISFNTTNPSKETLTIYPYKERKVKLLVNITVTPVQKTEVTVFQVKNKLKPGVYDIDEFLSFKGAIQTLYIFNKTEKINILPRVAYRRVNMSVVNGCHFFIYEDEFAFCSSPTKTIYKDRVNNEQIFMYNKTAFNSESTLIGLTWQQLEPGIRLFLIIASYKNKVYLIFYTVVYDLTTKRTQYWGESSTTITVPSRRIFLFNVSQSQVSFEHKTSKYLDQYQGIVYFTTNSRLQSYGYNVFGEILDIDSINREGTEMFGYGEYSGFIDSSVVSFSSYIPNIYESMVFFISHGFIMAKQYSVDHRLPPSPFLDDVTRFEFLKNARMINCGQVKYVAQQKLFFIRCLIVCESLDAFVYTFTANLHPSEECRLLESQRERVVDSDKQSYSKGFFDSRLRSSASFGSGSGNFDQNRVCAGNPNLVDIDSYFIPRGYEAKSIDYGRLYFTIFCVSEEAQTGELMIYKQGGPVGGKNNQASHPYV